MPQSQKSAATRPASFDAVLAHAWDADVLTATDVMSATGLTRTTAIDAIDALVDIGLLRELPNAREAGTYRKGRPARRFELAADAGILVGVDAGEVSVRATVTDLRSQPLGTARLTSERDAPGKPLRITEIERSIDQALSKAGKSRDDVLAICVGVPAPVNSAGESPPHPEGYWGRRNPAVRETLEKWAPIVRVENDASLAAVAEGSIGAAIDCRDYLALLAGERMGAGVVVDGRLLRGAHGGVGEMVAFEHVKGVESADGIGWLLTDWAEKAIRDGNVDPDGALATMQPSEVAGQAILELAAAGDPDAVQITDRAGIRLARTLSVLATFFDPSRIILSGAIAEGLEPVLSVAREHIADDLHIPAPEIVASELGGDVVAKGAIARASDVARKYVLDLRATGSE